MSARFAVYYAPECADPLWRAGCDWLGRGQPAVAAGWTEAAAMYGFHATLKAPFQLCCGEAELWERLAVAARQVGRFALPLLHVGLLDGYPALLAGAPGAALRGLADAMVTGLEPCRAVLSEAETARRRPELLQPAGREMLARWGYPEVFALWRFHMTLGRRDPPPALVTAAEAHFAAACAVPRMVETVCVFRQAAPDRPFELVGRQALG